MYRKVQVKGSACGLVDNITFRATEIHLSFSVFVSAEICVRKIFFGYVWALESCTVCIFFMSAVK